MGTSEGTDSLGVFKESSKVLDLLFNKYMVRIFDLVHFPSRILDILKSQENNHKYAQRFIYSHAYYSLL